ncbi:hypothetical protein EG344_23070 [Chryseobacterium sp. G0162]|uniref:hypothetical protein n=1 Tax=Chryseobacterium sp. G0162 TaxID=2487063 RepID=UPI000F503F1D|nr:hypothetical protein [Chryseobacterium sp. G0162]AZB11509.1 hypothetical protein EG344_23070 [Chryseobacterium sp. G0162]
MKISKLLYSSALLMFSLVSCQTKDVINSTKYASLTLEKKREIDEYIADAKKMIPKKEDEIVLMFQYNCFFDKKIIINDIYTKEFPKSNKIHYGQSIVNFSKNLGKIKIKLSDGVAFSIPQKKGYDYITICHNEKLQTIYIHYYDFPKILVEE